MEKRTSPVVCLALAASLWMLPIARAQEIITNVQGFAAVLDQSGCLYPLELPYEREGMPFWPQDEWFLDFSFLTAAAAAVTNYPSENHGGVDAWPLRAVQFAETGEVVLKYVGASTNVTLLQIAAPSDYVPFAHYDDVLGTWCLFFTAEPRTTPYTDLIADGYTFLDPPVIAMDAWAMSAADMDTYFANGAASSSAPCLAVSGFAAMDDGGDPCSITNLLQGFLVTGIAAATNRATSITFQSCQMFRYLISYANSLSNNESWIPLAYVWGATNASTTSWTDMSTTNNDGNTITQRFYRVQRLLGSPIAAGGSHSLAVTPDGKLWSWGSNNDGQLSDGLSGDDGLDFSRPYPGEVAEPTSCTGQFITNAVTLAGGGDEFIIVVDNSGTVWAGGDNVFDQQAGAPGYYNNEDHYPATAISGVSNVVNVAAGSFHVLALRADGAVFAWGGDTDVNSDPLGQLGVGGLPYPYTTSTPTQSLVSVPVVAIAAGAYHSLALDETGRVWAWGRNWEGQLGNGASGYGVETNAPIMVAGISNVIAIAAGTYHTIALTADKTVWTWGTNSVGELGRTGDSTVPGQVPNLSNVVAITGGDGFTLAVTTNGYVYGWGDGSYGELGVSVSASTNIPTQVLGISNAVLISASSGDPNNNAESHVVAMTLEPVDGTGQTTNRYWGWGANYSGEVGCGTTNANAISTPLPAQFCPHCNREVQLGTSGIFTAQCNGTLYLYFNVDQAQDYNAAGAYTAVVNSVQFTVPGNNNNGSGTFVGTVTNGQLCTYSATGSCLFQHLDPTTASDPNGVGTNGTWDCSNLSIVNRTDTVCPMWQCFSLVGRIQ